MDNHLKWLMRSIASNSDVQHDCFVTLRVLDTWTVSFTHGLKRAASSAMTSTKTAITHQLTHQVHYGHEKKPGASRYLKEVDSRIRWSFGHCGRLGARVPTVVTGCLAIVCFLDCQDEKERSGKPAFRKNMSQRDPKVTVRLVWPVIVTGTLSESEPALLEHGSRKLLNGFQVASTTRRLQRPFWIAKQFRHERVESDYDYDHIVRLPSSSGMKGLNLTTITTILSS